MQARRGTKQAQISWLDAQLSRGEAGVDVTEVDAVPYDSTGDGRVDALRPLKLGIGTTLSGGV